MISSFIRRRRYCIAPFIHILWLIGLSSVSAAFVGGSVDGRIKRYPSAGYCQNAFGIQPSTSLMMESTVAVEETLTILDQTQQEESSTDWVQDAFVEEDPVLCLKEQHELRPFPFGMSTLR